MAEQLGKLTVHVGGKQYACELLVPLEQLVAVEESTVSNAISHAVISWYCKSLIIAGTHPREKPLWNGVFLINGFKVRGVVPVERSGS